MIFWYCLISFKVSYGWIMIVIRCSLYQLLGISTSVVLLEAIWLFVVASCIILWLICFFCCFLWYLFIWMTDGMPCRFSVLGLLAMILCWGLTSLYLVSTVVSIGWIPHLRTVYFMILLLMIILKCLWGVDSD